MFDKSHTGLLFGGAIINGEIASVFKNFKTAKEFEINYRILPGLMRVLIANGGEKVVCQESLLENYKSLGFVPLASAKPTDNQPVKYYLMYLTNDEVPVSIFSSYKEAKDFVSLIHKNELGALDFFDSGQQKPNK